MQESERVEPGAKTNHSFIIPSRGGVRGDHERKREWEREREKKRERERERSKYGS